MLLARTLSMFKIFNVFNCYESQIAGLSFSYYERDIHGSHFLEIRWCFVGQRYLAIMIFSTTKCCNMYGNPSVSLYCEMFQYFQLFSIFLEADDLHLRQNVSILLDAYHFLRHAPKNIETFRNREYDERPTLNTT